MKAILNPLYILKPDNGRAFLQVKDVFRTKDTERYDAVIHPIHAMILSCFDGSEYDDCIKKAAQYLKTDDESIREFAEKLTENENLIRVSYDDKKVFFPKRTIIFTNDTPTPSRYQHHPDDFLYKKLNISLGRHQMVNDIMIMLTTKCKTDCVYCYATKEKKNTVLPFQVIKGIVDEAVKLNMRSIDIIGGDIFTYTNWQSIVKLLYDNEFTPFLSTKVELSEDDICLLKSIGVKDIQISLDTLIKKNLSKIVQRKDDYFDKIKLTIDYLEKYNIETIIHTIISRYNSEIIDMKSIYDYIKNKKNIKTWRIDPANYSIPKGEQSFINYRASNEKLIELYNYFDSNDFNLPIIYSSLSKVTDRFKKRIIQSKDFFSNRLLCTANYSSLFILPDGKVTICEQLYWNPRFIVGDVTKQSLKEIWNSKEALRLHYLQKEDLSDHSICKNCKYFVECRQKMGGVCWKEVISAYGDENWDFPDPSCPFAPEPFHDVYIKPENND